MEIKDWLQEAKEALEGISISDDKPLIDYAAACALTEIAYQLRRLATKYESTLSELPNGEMVMSVFDESRHFLDK